MNLYVWSNPYYVNWGGSVLYAVAETEEAAREQAARAGVSQYGYDPEAYRGEPLTLGAPDRVIACPCAEIYEWSE